MNFFLAYLLYIQLKYVLRRTFSTYLHNIKTRRILTFISTTFYQQNQVVSKVRQEDNSFLLKNLKKIGTWVYLERKISRAKNKYQVILTWVHLFLNTYEMHQIQTFILNCYEWHGGNRWWYIKNA